MEWAPEISGPSALSPARVMHGTPIPMDDKQAYNLVCVIMLLASVDPHLTVNPHLSFDETYAAWPLALTAMSLHGAQMTMAPWARARGTGRGCRSSGRLRQVKYLNKWYAEQGLHHDSFSLH